MQGLRHLGDFLAQWVFLAELCQRGTVVAGLRDLLGTIGKLRLELDAQAFAKALDAGLAAHIQPLGGAVQHVVHLFKRQVFGLQRLDEAHRVLGRAHVEFERREIDIGGIQNGFGPLHDRRRHVDDHDVEAFLRQLEKRLHLFGADQVERQDIGRRGKDRQLAIIALQRLAEGLLVHRLRLGQHFEDHVAARQVEIGRGRAELEIQIDQADRRRFLLVHIGQFPGQVHRQRGRAGAARHGLHGKQHAILAADGGGQRRCGCRGGGFRGGRDRGCLNRGFSRSCRRCRHGHRGLCHTLTGPNAFHRLVESLLGQRVGHEIIGSGLQQTVQNGRADVLGHEDDLDVAFLGLFDDADDQFDVLFIFVIDRKGHEFQIFCLRLRKESLGLHEIEVAPGFAQFGFDVIDQQVERLHVAGDGARHDRCGVRFESQASTHRHIPGSPGFHPGRLSFGRDRRAATGRTGRIPARSGPHTLPPMIFVVAKLGNNTTKKPKLLGIHRELWRR